MRPAASRACTTTPGSRRRRAGAARAPRPGERGLTMLEVVFAVVLLGLVATSASALLSLSVRLHTDNMQRLGAHEVANRIILMYLDARQSVPPESLPIAQGDYRYRFSVTEEPVRMQVKQTAAAVRSQGQVPLDRFKRVTVRVWVVAEGTEGRGDVRGEQMAELTRIYDPLADLFRNPDSRDRLVSSPEGLQSLIQRFSNITPSQPQGGSPAPASQGGGRGR